jgi:hypothetical protein
MNAPGNKVKQQDLPIGSGFKRRYMEKMEGGEGYAVAQLVETLRCKPESRKFDSRWNLCDFSSRQHNDPGVDSDSNRTEYQGSALEGRVKATGA